ncbi:hypothetical protein N657DRAFT_647874 [Parathielavia appendiculata]|uniref:Uncharacterized protein n=1 Tax=Parathielavia appendiculata TaxID=2587402 RepID=A0AAN6Z2K4_9PEZI|nr:hypothetical protein N657DRAFT_647874 [Parathielavia appendiculata]
MYSVPKGIGLEGTAKKRLKAATIALRERPIPQHWYDIRWSDEVHFSLGCEGRAMTFRKPGERHCSDYIQEAREPNQSILHDFTPRQRSCGISSQNSTSTRSQATRTGVTARLVGSATPGDRRQLLQLHSAASDSSCRIESFVPFSRNMAQRYGCTLCAVTTGRCRYKYIGRKSLRRLLVPGLRVEISLS